MMILLIMVLLLVPFFYFFVLYGIYQTHVGNVLTFHHAHKREMGLEEFLAIISHVNFDKINDSHKISRCGDIEVDNNLFRYKEHFLIFSFADFLLIKMFLFFKKNRNILGYAEKTDGILYIMRAVPGVGKSTKAKELIGDSGIIHSADDIMFEIGDGDYRKAFGMTINGTSALQVAHLRNMQRAIASMKQGISPVCIDNTNLKRRDIKPYVKEALKIGYKNENIIIVDLGTGGFSAEELAARNTHGVNAETIAKMITSYKNSGEVTLEKLFNNGK